MSASPVAMIASAFMSDLVDPKEWVFDGTAARTGLPSDLVKNIETNGHAFRDMD
jgi:hypothetical protein